MTIAERLRFMSRRMPLAAMSVKIIASHAGAIALIWVALRLF
jgi:hypothetical protein